MKIRFDPAQTRTERLLRVLESAPDLFRRESCRQTEPAPVRFGLVNTAMALSVVSDFLVPAVWPATAALLVGSNLRMFREAAAQLGRKQVGLPVLYTTIAAGTLATGQFLPWAVMNWMLRFWKQRYQDQLASSPAAAGRGDPAAAVRPASRLPAGSRSRSRSAGFLPAT